MALPQQPLRRRLTTPDYIYTSRTDDALVPFFENLFFARTDTYDSAVIEDEARYQMAVRLGYGCMRRLGTRLEAAMESGHYPTFPHLAEAGAKGCDWRYFPGLLGPDSRVLCFGVGGDISFEVAVATAAGCPVWCFDPTPGGIRCAEATMRRSPGIRFEPWGVGDRDEIVTFYGPRNGAPGSLSAANLGGGAAVVEAQMLRLSEIARRVGAPRIDLLKIDIEGSEYGVIADVVNQVIEVDQFLVEFDQPMPPWRTERAIERLLGAGYWLAAVWGLNACFVHERVLAAATAE